MREHTYNTGSRHLLMAEETIRWWNEYLKSDRACDYYIQRRGDILGFLYRLYGLSILRFTHEALVARGLLVRAIYTNFKYIFDIKVIAGIFMTFLGERFLTFFFRSIWTGKEGGAKVRRL